jgi:hypothetical protein
MAGSSALHSPAATSDIAQEAAIRSVVGMAAVPLGAMARGSRFYEELLTKITIGESGGFV